MFLGWVMFDKPSRIVDRVFIHCSASDNPEHDDWTVIDHWHRDRGWSGIGYHYFITKAGVVQKGRDLEKIPAAQKGHNKGSIAICLHGLEEDKFTESQFVALQRLCLSIKRAYEGDITFHGHKEVTKLKTCPVFNYKAVLGLDDEGYMTYSISQPKEKTMTKEAILGFIRHILTFGGGYATSAGLATTDEVTAGVGALVTLVGVIWSVLQKRKAA